MGLDISVKDDLGYILEKGYVHPPLYFNNATVKLTDAQKHLGLQLDSKLLFNKHTNNKISKATKAIGLLRKLQSICHVEAY